MTKARIRREADRARPGGRSTAAAETVTGQGGSEKGGRRGRTILSEIIGRQEKVCNRNRSALILQKPRTPRTSETREMNLHDRIP